MDLFCLFLFCLCFINIYKHLFSHLRVSSSVKCLSKTSYVQNMTAAFYFHLFGEKFRTQRKNNLTWWRFFFFCWFRNRLKLFSFFEINKINLKWIKVSDLYPSRRSAEFLSQKPVCHCFLSHCDWEPTENLQSSFIILNLNF